MRQVNVCPKTMLEYFPLISILEYFETQVKDMMFQKVFSLISLPKCLKHRPKRFCFQTIFCVDILANMLKTQAKEMMSQRKAARSSRRAELDAQVILRQINKGLMMDSAWEGCLLADAQSYVLVIDELNILMSRYQSREKLSPRWRLS